MLTFASIVFPRLVNVSDAVKLRIVPVVDFADHTSIGSRSFCIALGSYAKNDQMSVPVDDFWQVTPFSDRGGYGFR